MSEGFALDSSCVIALLASWHDRHAATFRAYQARRARQARLILPVHVLLESFSVLTRMPVRLAPEDAQRILEESFSETAEVAGVSAAVAWSAIRDVSRRETGGGIVYDSIIAQTAHHAGASVLLTWNTKDFLRVAPLGLEIVEP